MWSGLWRAQAEYSVLAILHGRTSPAREYISLKISQDYIPCSPSSQEAVVTGLGEGLVRPSHMSGLHLQGPYTGAVLREVGWGAANGKDICP